MSAHEKPTFTRPISAAFGRATGVFSRPKLQRRAYTAHAATDLISGVSLLSVGLDLKPQPSHSDAEKQHETNEETSTIHATLSPCLTTGNGPFLANDVINGTVTTEQKDTSEYMRGNIDNSNENHNTKTIITKNDLMKSHFSIECLKVKDIIQDVLKAQLGNMEYSHRECGEKGRIISQLIEKNVKALSGTQFKVMALVYIGAKRDEGIQLASRCLWTPDVDLFAMETFRTRTLFASGIVFATLYE